MIQRARIFHMERNAFPARAHGPLRRVNLPLNYLEDPWMILIPEWMQRAMCFFFSLSLSPSAQTSSAQALQPFRSPHVTASQCLL